jgi:hypothetical protein
MVESLPASTMLSEIFASSYRPCRDEEQLIAYAESYKRSDCSTLSKILHCGIENSFINLFICSSPCSRALMQGSKCDALKFHLGP